MSSDGRREIEGEVIRIEAVKYLEGGVGHAIGSLLFLIGSGILFFVGSPLLAWSLVIGAILVTLNGVSIWAWGKLRDYFASSTADASGPERTLTARPLSAESWIEMKAGAVMILVLCGLLVLGRIGVEFVAPRTLALLVLLALVLGNIGVLTLALFREYELS